jgi:hypothetical protein
MANDSSTRMDTQHASAVIVLAALAFLIAVRWFLGAPIVEVVSK